MFCIVAAAGPALDAATPSDGSATALLSRCGPKGVRYGRLEPPQRLDPETPHVARPPFAVSRGEKSVESLMVPAVRIELTTYRLQGGCSTN